MAKSFVRPVSTLLETVTLQAVKAGSAPFLEDARSDRTVSFGDLADAVSAWSSLGVPAEPLALVISDPLAFAVTYVSLVSVGATVVPLDPRAPAEENTRLMSQAKAQTVVADNNVKWAPNLIYCYTSGPRYHQTGEKSAPVAGLDSRQTSGAVLLFSSGSTGERKLIRLEQKHLLRAADSIASHHELGPGERGYNSLPLHHVNAEVVGVLASLRAGATLILDSAFHKTGFWKLMSERQVTWINAVPAILAILSAESADQDDNYDRSAIRFVRSASAPLAPAVLDRFEEKLGIGILETYGMTEGASQITANPLNGVRKPGSVGRPVDVELRIVDPERNLCDAQEVGVVEIRGDGVVTSYVDGVAATRFSDGNWLDTGDQGYVDEDGYLFLVGRTDDVINRGGEKIFPREIEDVLLHDRSVGEVIVAPRSDHVAGHVPIAYVQLASGARVDGVDDDRDVVERLNQLCESQLPRFMRPAQIVVLEELPRGVTGKLSRVQAAQLADQSVPANQ